MLFCSTMWAADLQALDVKTGQWETTTSGQMTGMPAIPPEVLAKLTPEQRAKMESAMGARGAKPIVSTYCLTKDKLEQAWNTGQSMAKNCTTHGDKFFGRQTRSSSGVQSERNEDDRHRKGGGGGFGAHSWFVSDDGGNVGYRPHDEHELHLHVQVARARLVLRLR